MPNVGQNPFENVSRREWEKRRRFTEEVRSGRVGPTSIPEQMRVGPRITERSMQTKAAVRGGQWGGIPQENSASAKSYSRRASTKEALSSGRYFGNNVLEKQMALNQRAYNRHMETLNAMKGN